ncbi:MAG: CoA transferase [Burkholderiales bacterium]|nr:CoA transferase [Burkholderiales bacterium]
MLEDLNERGPLQGLKVLDISNVIAGPFATAMLGDFGAEIVKVEMPGTGDTLRRDCRHLPLTAGAQPVDP